MEETQYLEITSARRDRNSFPLPGSFEIPLSQTGQKDADKAIDPVCISAAEYMWKGWSFNTIQSAANPSELVVIVDSVTISSSGTETIGDSSATSTLIVNTSAAGTSGRGALHTITDYYVGAVAGVGDGTTVPTTDRRRILSFTYLGDDKGKMVFESPFSGVITPGSTLLYISDPTSTDPLGFRDPYFFLPTGPTVSNGFFNYILFNLTRCQSRRVKSYDVVTRLIGIDTSRSPISTQKEGPINTWLPTDVFSLRRTQPEVCIGALFGDPTLPATFTSFNLNTFDADNIANPYSLTGSFLEVEMVQETGILQFQAGGNGTTVVQLRALSNPVDDYYTGAILRVLSGLAAGQLTKISSYDGATQLATLDTGFSQPVAAGDTYDLSFPQQSKRINKYVDYRDNAVGGSVTTVEFPINNTNTQIHPFYISGYYNDIFIRIAGQTRLIKNYLVLKNSDGTVQSATATIDPAGPPFGAPIAPGTPFTITSGVTDGGNNRFIHTISTQPAYILKATYDNLYPFINAQTKTANAVQDYEVELINLILPNQVLDSGFGSLISFYQYVYVEIQNTEGAGNSSSNNILSNNPNAIGTTFRATIDDVSNPINSTFIKIDGDGMKQIVKINLQQGLKFAVYLSTGSNPNEREIFKVLRPEHFSPRPPNPLIQISAMFSFKNVVTKSTVLAQHSINGNIALY
jgi:hypothetical protein